jgi:hypothetical protein
LSGKDASFKSRVCGSPPDRPQADAAERLLWVEMTRSQTPVKPALSNRNIEICQWVMPGKDVLISSAESGLAEASRPR